MVWARRTRIGLLVTLLLVAAALSWLASHPRLYAGQVGRLLTTNLLREAGASFSCRDLEGNPLSRMVFRGVTMTREGDDGSFLYLTADSLVVGYDLRDVFSRRTHLDEFVAGGVEILLRQGSVVSERGGESGSSAGELPSDLRVNRLGLLDLDMRITESDGAIVHEFRGLTLELAAEAASQGVDAILTRAEVEWVDQNVRLHRALGRVRLSPPDYQFTSMQVETDSIEAYVDVYVRVRDGLDSLRVEGTARSFELNELLRAVGKDGDGPRLKVSGDALVTKSKDELRIEASGSGHLDDAPVRGEEFVGVLVGDVLRFERIRGQYRSAQGEVQGRLRIRPEPLLELEGDFRGVDASDPWAAGEDLGWPTSDLQGHVRLALNLGDSTGISLWLEQLRGEAATLPVSDGMAVASWSETDGFLLGEARIQSQGARLEAYGNVTPSRQVALRVTARADSLGPWAREVALPIEGTGADLTGLLSGTLDSLRLNARGEVNRTEAVGVAVDRALVEVRIPRVVRRPGDVELDLYSPRLSVLGRPQGTVSLALRRVEPWIYVDRLSVARADSDLVARGRIEERADGRFAVQLDTLGTNWGPDQWRLVEGRGFDVADGYFDTDGLVFQSEVGRVSLEGGVRPPGVMDLSMDVREGDLNLLDRLDLVPGIRGGLNGHLEFRGTLDSTAFFVDATVDSLRLPGRRLEEARVVARADGPRLELDVFELESVHGGGGLDGAVVFQRSDWLKEALTGRAGLLGVWRQARLDLQVRPRELDLAHWKDPSGTPGRFGLLTAEVSISGPTSAPSAVGAVRLGDYPAPPFRFPTITGQVLLDPDGVRVEGGRVDLGGPQARFRAFLPLVVNLTDSLHFAADRGVEVELETPQDMDLAGLPVIWPDLRRTEGRGWLSFRASGDPRAPELSGEVEIRDGVVQLTGWSEWLRELEVEARFGGQELELMRITAREGAKGRVEGRGTVAFRGLLPDDVDLEFDAERVLISSVPDLKAIASGAGLRLGLERPSPGAPRAPVIVGSVLVDKAVYTGSFESEPGSAATLGPNVAPPWLARLRIRMQDQVRISNEFTELRVAGDVDFVRDTEGTRLRGEVEIPSGRVSILGTDFRITEGDLDFSRRPVEPEIDLTAFTEVPVYDAVGGTGRSLDEITVHMTGTFVEPDLRFSSKSGYDEASILRLLAGLQPTDAAGNNNAVGTLGLRAGFSVLERALAQEMTGVDTVEIVTTESAVDEMGSTRIAFGKYLTESVYLRYAQGFTAGERDILLEYQMSRRTLISGEIRSRTGTTGQEDEFNLDWKWRYRY